MALAATIKNNLTDVGVRTVTLRGTLALSSSYATGGDAWDLTRFAGFPVQTGDQVSVSVWGANGYGYGYVPGANLTNGKIKVTTASNTELAAGAYPAGVTGDTIMFEIVLQKL